jgi:kynurenine formamidase
MVSSSFGSGPARVWHSTIDWPTSTNSRIYDLAHELAPGIPHHPNHPAFTFSLTRMHGENIVGEGVSSAADVFTAGGHVGTHVDALSHISKGGRVHGGFRIHNAQSYAEGVGHNSIHELAPILAPAHLVDAVKLFDRDLNPADGIGADSFERWFDGRLRPGQGSVVCVRTGWGRHWNDPRKYLGRESGLPGVSLSGARWLADHGVAATGADTVDYNQVPDPTSAVHSFLLVEQGILIMEMLNLEGIAADEVYEFFFVAIPLPIRGGTGSPIRPLAIVS